MKINCLHCLNCLDIIYSRARHDFFSCTCGKVSIDGGRVYTRVVGDPKYFKQVIMDIDLTEEELEKDFYSKENRFGRIRPETTQTKNKINQYSEESTIPESGSKLWYLVPILFSIIGGVIAYFALRKNSPKIAKNCLIIGIVTFISYIVIMNSIGSDF